MINSVLAVDPGREKCGMAVVNGTAVIARAVVARDDLGTVLHSWNQRFAVAEIVVGNRTAAEEVASFIHSELPQIPVTFEDESGATLEARALYFLEHPRRGWRRLVPVGLQVPPEPYDDYAAVVVARRRLARGLPGNLERVSRKEEESP